MGAPKVKLNRKWRKGKPVKLMKLIQFKSSEAELFEALSVVFFVADQPSPAENKASIKAEDMFERYGTKADASKFKTVACPFCRQRVMQNPQIFTLPEGKGADIKLEDKVFDYIYSRFEKWQQIADPALKRPFETLKDRFEAAKKSDLDDIEKIDAYLKKRETVKVPEVSEQE